MKQTVLGTVLLVLACGSANAASFTPLGDLAGGAFFSEAFGVSADGSVLAGQSWSASGTEAFRWTGGVMTGLGDLFGGPFDSKANGVSADGSVAVGRGTSSGGTQAFRWTGGVMTGLGDLAGGSFFSEARGTSADGSVVVGISSSASGGEAFRWTGGVMTGLGDLAGGSFFSEAFGVSADGSVVVGYGNSASGIEAFRWTGGVMTGLGDLAGGIFDSIAFGVSADGSVVVGESTSASGTEAFRWTGGVMTGLGDLAGGSFFSRANGVSADGSAVVGFGTSASGTEAFRWTAGGGMARLIDVLVAGGATGLTGWTLLAATAISADGQWISGWGTNSLGQSEAFLANISVVPVPPAVDLTSGTTGGLLLNQSFNGETRSADVTLLGGQNRQIVSMTLAGVGIRNSSALVGVRIYAGGGTLIASADLSVAIGENQNITIPISATLTAGGSYRLAFFVPSSASGNGGDLFDPVPAGPGGFGYVELQGLFQVNGGFRLLGDAFPTTASATTIPRISIALVVDSDADGILDAADNCSSVSNTLADVVPGTAIPKFQLDSDNDGFGNRCDGDLNNTGAAFNVNTTDYTILRSVINKAYTYSTNAARADLDGSGTVNTTDYTIFRSLINNVPGPSGYTCAGTVPCP